MRQRAFFAEFVQRKADDAPLIYCVKRKTKRHGMELDNSMRGEKGWKLHTECFQGYDVWYKATEAKEQCPNSAEQQQIVNRQMITTEFLPMLIYFFMLFHFARMLVSGGFSHPYAWVDISMTVIFGIGLLRQGVAILFEIVSHTRPITKIPMLIDCFIEVLFVLAAAFGIFLMVVYGYYLF